MSLSATLVDIPDVGNGALTRRDSTASAAPPAPTPRPLAAPALRTDGLTKTYGARNAVDGVSIEVPAGVVAGFVGPNGAGKTTTIRMLLALIRPTAGSVEVLGTPVTRPADYLPRVGALLLAPSHGISTAAWFTGAGVQTLLATAGNLLLATLAWGAIGAGLATVPRSTAVAIASGLAYAFSAWCGATVATSAGRSVSSSSDSSSTSCSGMAGRSSSSGASSPCRAPGRRSWPGPTACLRPACASATPPTASYGIAPKHRAARARLLP